MNLPPPTRLGFLGRHSGLMAVLIASAAVRLWDLPDWWLNPDEGIYYSILTRADYGDFWQELSSNAHPPLYYLLLRGLGFLTWDFLWFRVLSVLSGIAAVAGVFVVARRLSGEGDGASVAGFVAALLLAFAPGAVGLSQVMRPYMLQLAFLTWALFFLLRSFETSTTRDLGAYAGLACLALATHYGSLLALGVFGLLVLAHGFAQGFATPAWRRLALWHALPAAMVVLLYFIHLRPLSNSALATEALDGWLSYFMIHSPGDVWWSLLGFQRLIALPWLHGPIALLLLASLAVSVAKRETRVTILLGGALLIAIVGAGTGFYPFGSSRHSTWVMAFALPVLGWLAAQAIGPSWREQSIGRVGARLAVPVALLLLGGPVGDLIGMERARLPQTERILRQDDLTSMVAALDPSAEPELIVMSSQTFYLLLPFYPSDRESATFTPDGTSFHFQYGARRVLVSTAWDFTVREESDGTRTPNQNGVFDAPLGGFLNAAHDAFPGLAMGERDEAVLLVGGWPPDFLGELQVLAGQADFVLSWQSVPGLFAFQIGLQPLREALGVGGLD